MCQDKFLELGPKGWRRQTSHKTIMPILFGEQNLPCMLGIVLVFSCVLHPLLMSATLARNVLSDFFLSRPLGMASFLWSLPSLSLMNWITIACNNRTLSQKDHISMR